MRLLNRVESLVAVVVTTGAIMGLGACATGGNGTLPSSSGTTSSGAASGSGSESGASGAVASGTMASSSGGGLAVSDATAPPMIGVTDALIGDVLACATETQRAKLTPLDLYFLFDTSGSMDNLVAPTESKWQAVTAAIKTFLGDPASAGLGLGVQFFPKLAPGVPASCTSNAQCGAAGPCFLHYCYGAAGVIACNVTTDCPIACISPKRCFQTLCVPAGECANDHDAVCPAGSTCGPDPSGFALGACQTMTASYCVNGDDCAAVDYATPSVPIAVLPGVAPTIAAALAAHQPNGGTPTEAALTGVINGAKAYAMAHPQDTVVAVLATDGQPDEAADPTNQCAVPASAQAANTQVANVAAAGLASSPSIKTFGIGVFTPGDIASGTATLDQLAMAGGTGKPFIIGTANNTMVEQQFEAALTAIRGASLPCNYQVPTPQSGTPDYSKINVSFTSGAGATSYIPYVESAGGCDPTQGGWYYNADPAEGGTPTTIDMCPTACTALKGDAMGRVDIVLGCRTVTLIR